MSQKRNKARRKKFIYRTNFFLINQLCLSTGIKKNPICEKDCMKIKLSVMSCSCMAIALWWHYWMFVLMTVNRLFPVSGYTLLSRVFSLVFITLFIPVFHLGPHHKVLSQGAPLLFFLDFNLQLFFSKWDTPLNSWQWGNYQMHMCIC